MINNYTLPMNRWLWLTITMTLLIVGAAFVPAAAAQNSDAPQLTVVAAVVSVREGPGMTYPAIDYLWQDDQVTAIGYDAAGDWWEVKLSNGDSGWVNGGEYYVSVSGDTSQFLEPVSSQIETIVDSSTATVDTSQSGTIVFQTSSGGDIYAINADGTNLRYLTTGMDPAISPDGQWVAFTRWESDGPGSLGSVWVINIDGTDERVVLNDVRQPKSPTWSVDGSQVVISYVTGGRFAPEYHCGSSRPSEPLLADEDGNYFEMKIEIDDDGNREMKICYTLLPRPFWGLRVVDVATGEFEDLTSDKFSYAPTWNPANDWQLVYNGEQGLTSLDMNQNTRWLLTEDVNDHTPVFSPDGSKIAVSFRQNDHWEIHVMNADGSNRQRLTETSYIALVEQTLAGEESYSFNNAAPAWSPDGSQIAFLTDRTGRWEIWVMNADGSDQRPMFDNDVLEGLGLNYVGVDERMLSWQ